MKEVKIPTFKERGKMGAAALNADPVKKSNAVKKAAQTRMAKNPNIFREMGAKGGGHKHNKKDKGEIKQ